MTRITTRRRVILGKSNDQILIPGGDEGEKGMLKKPNPDQIRNPLSVKESERNNDKAAGLAEF